MEKRRLVFLGLLLATMFSFGCFGPRAMMTKEVFSEIEPGMSIAKVQELAGSPYQVYSRDGDSDTYEYIERITMGNDVVMQRRYYLIISKKRVVGKYMKFSTSPAFDEIYSDSPYPNY